MRKRHHKLKHHIQGQGQEQDKNRSFTCLKNPHKWSTLGEFKQQWWEELYSHQLDIVIHHNHHHHQQQQHVMIRQRENILWWDAYLSQTNINHNQVQFPRNKISSLTEKTL